MLLKIKTLFILAIIVAVGTFIYKNHQSDIYQATQQAAEKAKAQAAAVLASHCKANTAGQAIVVSISKRHMWVCSGTKVAYDSPVVTGMENFAADLTPTGTYTIYDKLTNQDLRGSDSTGSWDNHVDYWLPFLDNQYGTYGFHDATWRKDSDFGNISPYSNKASHGCVEVPLAAMKWLYDWTPVGTKVSIET